MATQFPIAHKNTFLPLGESRFCSAAGWYNPYVSLSLHFSTVLRFYSFSFLHLSGLIIHISDLILHSLTTCFSSRGIIPNSSASCRNISHIFPASFVTWVLLTGLNFWRWATNFHPSVGSAAGIMPIIRESVSHVCPLRNERMWMGGILPKHRGSCHSCAGLLLSSREGRQVNFRKLKNRNIHAILDAPFQASIL